MLRRVWRLLRYPTTVHVCWPKLVRAKGAEDAVLICFPGADNLEAPSDDPQRDRSTVGGGGHYLVAGDDAAPSSTPENVPARLNLGSLHND